MILDKKKALGVDNITFHVHIIRCQMLSFWNQGISKIHIDKSTQVKKTGIPLDEKPPFIKKPRTDRSLQAAC
jgi:hypothetical protein